MKTDTEIRVVGVRSLVVALGAVDAERFVALMLREPFDYTEWRQGLWREADVETLAREAAAAVNAPSRVAETGEAYGREPPEGGTTNAGDAQ